MNVKRNYACNSAPLSVSPGYAAIGVLGPLLVLIGRWVQEFSAGAEPWGRLRLSCGDRHPGNKGFYCSWQLASVQLAVIFAWLLGVGPNSIIPADQMTPWCWRIPFLIGCLMIPVAMILRRSLKETEEFADQKRHPTCAEVLRIIGINWPIMIQAVMLSSLTTTTFRGVPTSLAIIPT